MYGNIERIIPIGDKLHVETQPALEILLKELKQIGYTIKDLRESNYRKDGYVSVETMEKNGWPLWEASLDVRRGKCKSCNGFIELSCIQSHGHRCELCGAVTYYEIIDGSEIRFSFVEKVESYSFFDISMKARRWDTETGYLYLYPEVADGLWLRGEAAEQYFKAKKDEWEEVEEDGRKFIKLRYIDPVNTDEAPVIKISEIFGHYSNHEIVLVWEGKEYDEFSPDFPVPQSISIHETWHWPQAPPT